MKASRFVAAAIGAAVILVAGAASAAPIAEFEGTRGMVRMACTGDGLILVEGLSWSYCVNAHTEAGVTCRDDGLCVGSGPVLASFANLWLTQSAEEIVPASLPVPSAGH